MRVSTTFTMRRTTRKPESGVTGQELGHAAGIAVAELHRTPGNAGGEFTLLC